MSLFVNAPGHDADLALAGRNDARAVRADEARFLGINGGKHTHHVDDRNAFGDANDQRNFRIGGFEDGVGGVRRRHEDYRSVGARAFHGFGNGIEYGALQMLGAAFARRNSPNDVGSILNHLLRVEGAFTAGKALNDQACFFVNKNAHRAPPARATTFCAASFMPSAMVKLRPESRRICWPFSTLVPSMRTTTGTLMPRAFAA